ncbi:MAG: LytTR family DNA-binding domain-containing protein [Bacteroidetes bacterium]|nr:LytTR family DNA-binding domain-containing protein [Bacteroidota bacterium]MBU1115358.1 LytTR family DNA-binding domain-containing protein [Bacteroidota bacterium]MBU1800510.1 LytTR family DNA-binding domain-containing protein [Bacteroidota bacterium]
MNILIIEDEPPIAEYIKDLTQNILGNQISSIITAFTIEDALSNIKKTVFDLCLLDMNIMGTSGFELFKLTISQSFHTIVISAHTEQAITAFEYGVIDFVPKPFDKERLQLSFERYFGRIERSRKTKHLVYRKKNVNHLIAMEDIKYFLADNYLVHAYHKDGSIKIIEKPLKKLEQILSNNFVRIHRSFIVNLSYLKSFKNIGGGVYQVLLTDDTKLPLSRSGLKILQHQLSQ